jgi:hypothetical protein
MEYHDRHTHTSGLPAAFLRRASGRAYQRDEPTGTAQQRTVAQNLQLNGPRSRQVPSRSDCVSTDLNAAAAFGRWGSR